MIRQSIMKRLDKMEAAFIHRPTEQEKETHRFLEADPEAQHLLEQIMRLKHDQGKTYIELLETSKEARRVFECYLDRHREWKQRMAL